MESSNLDAEGRPRHDRVEDLGNAKYAKAFELLTSWVDGGLDIHKVSPFVIAPHMA